MREVNHYISFKFKEEELFLWHCFYIAPHGGLAIRIFFHHHKRRSKRGKLCNRAKGPVPVTFATSFVTHGLLQYDHSRAKLKKIFSPI
jgi:hypothetical protein